MLCRSSKTTDRIREFVFKRTARFIQHDAGPANGILWSWWGAGLQAWANREAARWPKTAARVRAAGRRLSMFGRTADIAHGLIRQLYRTQGQRAAAKARLIQLLGRTDDLPSVEWFFNWWYHPYMKLLMRRYDVVQCYATYTAMPFIIGHPYTAYEHGTIRTIPFQNTDEGKMCLATYRAAEGVFVTNTDNLVAADRMNIPRRQVTPLPHAFDSDKLVRFARKTKSRPPSSMVTFFTPTRQHWVDQDPGWAKGNDRVFHALKIVREAGKLCKVVAIAWGHDLEASKELAAKLGVADLVVWIPKLNKRQLWRKYLESHAVFDQFLCPALGGVTFEALMLGRRVITAIDEPVMTDFFGDLPPLYNCSTAEDIAAAMLRVIADPMDRAGDGDRNRRWMERRHSASTIVRLQVERYQKILATRTTAISKTRAETDKSGRTLVNS
jgi:glycosyltransferase involved in cell wall biosynthesis